MPFVGIGKIRDRKHLGLIEHQCDPNCRASLLWLVTRKPIVMVPSFESSRRHSMTAIYAKEQAGKGRGGVSY